MPWIQIKLDCTPDSAGTLEDWLLEAGSAAVTLQDGEDNPVYEPIPGSTPLWKHTVVVGLFDALMNINAVVGYLNEKSSEPLSYKIEILEDKDWEREWMTHFEPMQFGKRLWVCPSWKAIPDESAINLLLDPGLAFGTGTHATTRLCLEWLEKQGDLSGKAFVDYGCGSGILAIAALLLGADRVTSVDIDPQALEATRLNADRNGVPTEKLPVYLPESAPTKKVDGVIANILVDPLVELAPILAGYLNPGGHIAMSGILLEQADRITNVYAQWFKLDPVVEHEGWVLISGEKK